MDRSASHATFWIFTWEGERKVKVKDNPVCSTWCLYKILHNILKVELKEFLLMGNIISDFSLNFHIKSF